MPSTYTSPHLDDREVDRRALAIITQHLDGLPIGQARLVLRRAEIWIDAATALDAQASEFQRARAAL